MSSPYLCVFGDDHVTRYMGADVDVGEMYMHRETEWGSLWDSFS